MRALLKSGLCATQLYIWSDTASYTSPKRYSEVILKEQRVKTSRHVIDFGANFVHTNFQTLHYVLILFKSLFKPVSILPSGMHFTIRIRRAERKKRQEANQCVPKHVPTRCIQFHFQYWCKKSETLFIIQFFTKIRGLRPLILFFFHY